MTNQSPNILDKKTLKTVSNQFALSKNIQLIGNNSILEDPSTSQIWLVNSLGHKLRTICGHRKNNGITCLRASGYGTDHTGYGKCKDHSKNLFFNPNLNVINQMPTRLGELIEANAEMEEILFNSVDPEIIKLESLIQYIMTSPREEGEEISIEEISLIKDLVKEIVKAKVTRVKILREMRIDTTLIKDFVNNVFKVVLLHTSGPVARKIYNDILNTVLVPFKNRDRFNPSELTNSADEKLEELTNLLENKE